MWNSPIWILISVLPRIYLSYLLPWIAKFAILFIQGQIFNTNQCCSIWKKIGWMENSFALVTRLVLRVSGFIALFLLGGNMLASCWQWLIKYGTTSQNDGMSLDSDNGLIMDRNNINNYNLYLHLQSSRHHWPSPPDRRQKSCVY